MKVLLAHVPYGHRGGEDVHVDVLARAYRELGADTVVFPEDRRPPEKLLGASVCSLLPGGGDAVGLEALWNRERPDFIHLHNAFPLLGPRFFRWVLDQKVPLLMTVHNHRFFCTNGLALRDGRVCKDCFASRMPWRPIAYNCNGDFTKSTYHALALREMHAGDLYRRAVRRFVAPSPYIKEEIVRWGADPARVTYLLNPVELGDERELDPVGPAVDVFYAGRLSHEKGIAQLLRAVEAAPDLKFAIAGDGPERNALDEASARLSNLYFFPGYSHRQVLGQILSSKIGVLASICNEILPSFVLECFALGRRCVVPDLESTRAFAGPEWGGRAVDATDLPKFLVAIRETLAAPEISGREVAVLRERLGFTRFKRELRILLDDFAENK
ncbi:MAG: glycosyltransferase family 4 protein [Deltaproteobacteria bacterium]|nr:glycosyltransferase family 4 protein [Deltaproteobacteria bacterium]